MGPQVVVDIGTYTGQRACAWRKGWLPVARYTIDVNEDWHRWWKHIERAGMQDRIVQHLKPAPEVVPTCPHPSTWCSSMPIRKLPGLFHLVVERMRPGGSTWRTTCRSGRVTEPETSWDAETRGLAEYARP